MRAVIIDDERPVRDGLAIMLSYINGVEVIGEANSVESGEELIVKEKPDIVFLDIQLKNKTGFDLLDQLPYLDFHLIFITAYNQYALQAFKYNAFNYLLKPIDPEELSGVIQRLLDQNSSLTSKQIPAAKENNNFENIIIKTVEEIYVIPIYDIIRCEADKGYTFFFLKDGRKILSSKTLKEYESLLPSPKFLRVHQSHLINKDFMSSYEKSRTIIMKEGTEIPVSVRKRPMLLSMLKKM